MAMKRLNREGPVASSELYVDKVVKFISGLLQLILGIVVVVLAHVIVGVQEQYKTYSILIVCEACSLLFVLVMWYWCYGDDVANHVQELIHHANHLTNQYGRYSEIMAKGGGLRRDVSEATLHGDLDNYLEYLLHVLTLKGERLYIRHVAKWVVVLVMCFLWLLGFVALFAMAGGLPQLMFLKVLWVIPLLILLGTIILIVFHLLYDLCKPRDYEATFFFRVVPGAMDARLSRLVEDTFNPRYVWLLSRHCWQNAKLLHNAGLSKSLARKYCYISVHDRHDRWRDQHFPTLRSDQVERFKFSSQQFVESGLRGDNKGCCFALLWCGLTNNNGGKKHRKKRNMADRSNKVRVGDGGGDSVKVNPYTPAASSGYSSGILTKPSLYTVAEDGYMTPHLFARKLAKEAYTPEDLLEEEIAHNQQKKKREGKRLDGTKSTPRDDIHVASIGPQKFPTPASSGGDPTARVQLGLSRDDTEVDYGAFYQPHERDPQRMKREYDPLTYGVRMNVKKEMAKDVHVWRP